MTSAATSLPVSTAQREVLEKVARSSTAAHREVVRPRVLLDAADGVANTVIAQAHGVTPVTVRSWCKAFADEGLTNWGKVNPVVAVSRGSPRRRSSRSWS